LKNEAGAAEKLGLSESGFAIFGVLTKGPQAKGEQVGEIVSAWGTEESRKELASLIEEATAPFTDLVDWVHKADIERQLRQQVKRQLRAAQCPLDRLEPVTASIVDLLKARQGSR
jgi:type I restriction enzyme, R subunit